MLRTYFQETFYDMPVDVAQKYADIIRNAVVNGKAFDGEKKHGYFISKNRSFEDKLYVGNIHRIENRLYYRDEELQEDDQIINVVMLDGPITRDGDGCSYGSKDHRDQILYANTIQQVVGHLFVINTPGGASSARIDYEQAIADCRKNGKPTVAWVDGMCASAGQLVAALCDRTIAMNGRHTMGCIGTMCAFWGVSNGTVDQDGLRYIELVSVTTPDKNAEFREACDGKTKKLQDELDKLGNEFRETVRQNRPLVKEENLTGKVFDADDVMGELVDEIGDYERAIQAVFDLAGGLLKPAREVTVVEDTPGEGSGGEQEELDQLNEQQITAIHAHAGEDVEVEDGHVYIDVETMLGTMKKELANPYNKSKNMTEEERKAAEDAEQPAAAQEEEQSGQQADEGVQQEQQPEEVIQQETREHESQEAPQNAPNDIDKIRESLNTAEKLVEQKDQEISDLKASLDDKQNSIKQLQADVDDAHKSIDQANETIAGHVAAIASRDAAIKVLNEDVNKLTKQVNDLKAEIKEMAAKPAPMANADSGIPADNGTGDAPDVTGTVRSTVTAGMSAREIRDALRKQDEDAKVRFRRR